MPRALPMSRLLQNAHHLAEVHAAKHGTPNEAAFWEEWDAFTKRNERRLYDLDLMIICAYAMAALHYTPRKRYWVKASGEFIPMEHEAVDMPRGMWAGRNPGNINTEVAA